MRLNICCGRHVLPGWTNIDVEPYPNTRPEIIADARKIPLQDGCADEIMVIHGWEHFYRWECDDLIAEWMRLLRSGGLLVLELPDLLKCCANILKDFKVPGRDPDQLGMWGLYGDPRPHNPLMMHRWGWSPKTLRAFLEGKGFVGVVELETQWHSNGKGVRDMRLEATRA